MLTKEECSGSIGKRSNEGHPPSPVSTKEFEKARKKCLTNGIECGNLVELLARAARDTAKFLLKELQKVLKNLKKSS